LFGRGGRTRQPRNLPVMPMHGGQGSADVTRIRAITVAGGQPVTRLGVDRLLRVNVCDLWGYATNARIIRMRWVTAPCAGLFPSSATRYALLAVSIAATRTVKRRHPLEAVPKWRSSRSPLRSRGRRSTVPVTVKAAYCPAEVTGRVERLPGVQPGARFATVWAAGGGDCARIPTIGCRNPGTVRAGRPGGVPVSPCPAPRRPAAGTFCWSGDRKSRLLPRGGHRRSRTSPDRGRRARPGPAGPG
jgi:hypothetical protein